MHGRTFALMAIFVFGAFLGGSRSLAFQDDSSPGASASIASSGETSREIEMLRQLAAALAAGGDSLQRFRGSAIQDEEGKNRLRPQIPGMNCSLDSIANYVACYGSTIENKKDADSRFFRFIGDLRAVLPPADWLGVEPQPRVDAVRSYTFEDRNSGAHIDIDLVRRLANEENYSYLLTIYGWGVL